MLRRLIRGCTCALIGAASVCVVATSEAQVFDAPQFIEGFAFPAREDSTAWIAGLAPSSDGSIWVVIVRPEEKRARLATWCDGNLTEVALLEISLAGGRSPCRFVERTDGLLQLVGRSRAWVLHQDGSLIREWPLSAGYVDVDRSGLVFALNDRTIKVFDDEGRVIRAWTTPNGGDYFAVAPGGRVIVIDHGDWETWQPMMRVYSPYGELLEARPCPDVPWDRRLWVLPSGTLLFLNWDAYQSWGGRGITARSQCGVDLLNWWWEDPDDRCSGSHEPPAVVTEDHSGRLVTATAEPINCYLGPRIDVYAPFGPGVIVQPPVDDVPYTVDGASYVGRHRLDLAIGSTHTFAVATQTLVSPGTRRDLVKWSDNGAASHEIEIPSVGIGLQFEVETRHFVETIVDEGGSATTSAWIKPGSEVTLSAVPAEGYRFVKWSHLASTDWREDVLEPEWTHAVTGPESWKAVFMREGLVLTISASGTDPWANADAPANGPRQLWLWAPCLDRGISALEADVAGSLTATTFIPDQPICLSLGDGPNLFLAIGGCPIGAEANVRLGSWWVMDYGGDFCLAPSAAWGELGVVDCPALLPQLNPVGVVGFSSVGEPCRIGEMCGGESIVTDHAGIPEPSLPATLPTEARLAAHGNPFHSTTDLVADLPIAGRVDVRIFDVAGRLVRTLWSGELAAGRRIVTWDGRSGDGAAVPASIYFARMEGAGAVRIAKLVRLQP